MTETKQIWIVEGATGEYSDHTEWAVCAFYSEEKAKELTEQLSLLAIAAHSSALRFGSVFDFKKTNEGKKWLEHDPMAQMDYSGVNYTAYSITIRDDK